MQRMRGRRVVATMSSFPGGRPAGRRTDYQPDRPHSHIVEHRRCEYVMLRHSAVTTVIAHSASYPTQRLLDRVISSHCNMDF